MKPNSAPTEADEPMKEKSDQKEDKIDENLNRATFEDGINIIAHRKLTATANHKIVLFCGETGSGKTTLINSMANYIYKVQFGDKFRLALTAETELPTQRISSYTIDKPPNGNIDYDLTIIDTPGFTDDVQKCLQTADDIQHLCRHSLNNINAICFVVKSASCRLSTSQRHIWNCFLNLWGKDVMDNICIFMTFADGKKPPCNHLINIDSILKDVPTTRRFELNSSSFVLDIDNESSDDHDQQDDLFARLYWDMGMKGYEKFFDYLDKIEPVSLENSTKVYQYRNVIQTSFQNMFVDKKEMVMYAHKIKQMALRPTLTALASEDIHVLIEFHEELMAEAKSESTTNTDDPKKEWLQRLKATQSAIEKFEKDLA